MKLEKFATDVYFTPYNDNNQSTNNNNQNKRAKPVLRWQYRLEITVKSLI